MKKYDKGWNDALRAVIAVIELSPRTLRSFDARNFTTDWSVSAPALLEAFATWKKGPE
jgi:hypothetical protein